VSLKTNAAAAAAALTVLVAPAFASAYALNADPQIALRHHDLRSLPGTFALASSLGGAQVYQARGVRTPIVRAPDGRYLGTDPDPAIRRELGRDWLRGAC
jgi:hypothetical protein